MTRRARSAASSLSVVMPRSPAPDRTVPAQLAADERRWAAVLARDPAARFVYAVASTGVYCLPTCPARRPLRKNVVFHETCLAAELCGYRPCKRCRPHSQSPQGANSQMRAVLGMCRLIEESVTSPSLAQLAKHAELSPSHAHRLFSRTTGLSPKAYREAIVRARVRREFESSRTVVGAAYAAGFGSSSRFYEHAARLLGMPPSVYRRGAPGLRIRFAVGECSLGSILVASTDRGVCCVLLGDEPAALLSDLERRFPQAELVGGDAAFEAVVARVVGEVESQPGRASEALPLDLRGTVFQARVWRALQAIPAGATTTYSQLARSLGMPTGARAVARACAENPLAVLVPCHRVVRGDGGLAGYRWGLERKRTLLAREAATASAQARD